MLWKIEFVAEELERLLSPVLTELCRLANEFEFPEPSWGTTKVRARGKEYEYQVLRLKTGDEFLHAKKIYLNNDRRRELAARYEMLYRRIEPLLKALKAYCLGVQDTAKPRRDPSNGLAASIGLNQGQGHTAFHGSVDDGLEDELEEE